MVVNFSITENYALSIAGRHIDLHNNFDFVGFEYNVSERTFTMNWKKSRGDWVDKNELSNLVLIHSSVTFLRIKEQGDYSTFEGASCLGEISFFPSAEREIDDSIMPQTKPNEGDDIIYFFENGKVIRIHCEKIELKLNLLPLHLSNDV